MKNKNSKNILLILLGGLLLGFLWRVRGTGGWGSSWGLLNAGFVYALFLNFAVKKEKGVSLPLLTLCALAFMLTCPAWGTQLNQITGVLSVSAGDGDPVLYEISPVSGVIMMLCLGFGLASVYGVLLGRGFGTKAWRLRDYALVLLVFIAVDLLAKATVSHGLLKLIEPQAETAFLDGLREAGISGGAYKVYLSHFNAVSWAKKIAGGRHYFQSVGTLSLAVSAVAVLLTTRFAVRDRYAARTGAVTCSAFAFSITLSDLFFFFDNGGFRGAQGFTLPEGFAAWSLWEYFTGFFAGLAITAWLLKTASLAAPAETLLRKLPEKPGTAAGFLFWVVGGVGINTVRPVLERLDGAAAVIAAAAVGLAVLAAVLVFRKKLIKTDARRLSPLFCLLLVCWDLAVYLFIGKAGYPNIRTIGQAHNLLAVFSAAAVAAACAAVLGKKKSPAD